jgi:hypothetical protein
MIGPQNDIHLNAGAATLSFFIPLFLVVAIIGCVRGYGNRSERIVSFSETIIIPLCYQTLPILNGILNVY